MKISKLVLLFVLCLLHVIGGCVANVGQTIETPEIPAAATRTEARARLGSYVSIQGVQDLRTYSSQTPSSENFTEPQGGTTTAVETGLKNALRDAGISVLESAPITLRAEIKKWRAQVTSKASSNLASEATIYVELLDPSGRKLYTGSYNGTRSSQFPVITRIDIKDSLGLAMSNALSQLVADEQLLNIVSSY